MIQLGYSLSCEEHRPNDLVRYAQRAEEAGFTYAMISDHYHPWISRPTPADRRPRRAGIQSRADHRRRRETSARRRLPDLRRGRGVELAP